MTSPGPLCMELPRHRIHDRGVKRGGQLHLQPPALFRAALRAEGQQGKVQRVDAEVAALCVTAAACPDQDIAYEPAA
ncbi:hypothetical protein [Streptomyces flaveolus]|uniref:hypothetical protein n=1 Tax=Streptomyces flaveolus TaxID=67297 RepID=UPI003701CCD1